MKTEIQVNVLGLEFVIQRHVYNGLNGGKISTDRRSGYLVSEAAGKIERKRFINTQRIPPKQLPIRLALVRRHRFPVFSHYKFRDILKVNVLQKQFIQGFISQGKVRLAKGRQQQPSFFISPGLSFRLRNRFRFGCRHTKKNRQDNDKLQKMVTFHKILPYS